MTELRISSSPRASFLIRRSLRRRVPRVYISLHISRLYRAELIFPSDALVADRYIRNNADVAVRYRYFTSDVSFYRHDRYVLSELTNLLTEYSRRCCTPGIYTVIAQNTLRLKKRVILVGECCTDNVGAPPRNFSPINSIC